MAGKTVLITGCSAGGIGHALAVEFHARGHRVIATARRPEAMSELAALGITTLQLDVTDEASIRKVHDEVAELTGGKLDILVNNAGQGMSAPATDLDLARVRALFDVNLFSVMAMVKTFIPLLIASGGDARIIQIGSTAGILPASFGSAYNATKAAVHAYSNTLRVELAPFGVKVTTVVTGGVRTNIQAKGIGLSTLPRGSLYLPMEELYENRRVKMSQDSWMPADAYARTVVSEALSARPRAWLWAGSGSWIVWFLDTFAGRRVFDYLLSKMFGLSEFGGMLKRAKAKTA
ncbi:hypothetical protein PLICRDRAFT_42884 [Plicaturopsis crispa FD-325 SS-3]|nr:hypothetical protein PLICRDRAFT_42884 [Plicaturopsis crispa FD-325 SS-3]